MMFVQNARHITGQQDPTAVNDDCDIFIIPIA